MTGLTEFTIEEFADYWDSIGDDMEAAVDFMARNVVTDEGRDYLGSVATRIAQRHGVSSDKMKNYRMGMRKACKKAGIDDIFTPKKVKGTGTKDNPDPVMDIIKSKPQENPEVDSDKKLAYNRMRGWVKKGMSVSDIKAAADKLYDEVTFGL